MIIGSNENPYKRLLESSEVEEDDEQYYLMESLLQSIYDSIDRELEYVNDTDYQSSINDPVEDYYTPMSASDSVDEYGNTIEFVKDEIELLDNYSDEMILDYLASFLEENREEVDVSYDERYKVGSIGVFLNTNQEVYLYFDTRIYIHPSYDSRHRTTTLGSLLKEIDSEYIENNFKSYMENHINKYPQSSFNKLIDYESDILELIEEAKKDYRKSDFYFSVDMEDFFGDKVDPFDIYINDEDAFISQFTSYLNSRGLLGYSATEEESDFSEVEDDEN